MRSSVWLFTFTGYTYCQGTRDVSVEVRLITFTLPCEEWEAKAALIKKLKADREEFDEDSIKSLTYKVTNS